MPCWLFLKKRQILKLLQIIVGALRDIYCNPFISGSPATEDSENVAPAKKLKKDEPSS